MSVFGKPCKNKKETYKISFKLKKLNPPGSRDLVILADDHVI